MRDLLGQGKVFRWLPEHEEEFAKMKSILSDKLLTRHFDPSLPVQLSFFLKIFDTKPPKAIRMSALITETYMILPTILLLTCHY